MPSTINPNVPGFQSPLLSSAIRAQFQAAINDINAILNSGILLAINNLGDLQSIAAAVTNLGLTIGVNTQAWSSVLDYLATTDIASVRGNSTKLQLASGSFTAGNAATFDSEGNLIDSGSPVEDIFEVGGFIGGKPPASALVFAWKFLSAVNFPANFSGSAFYSVSATAATASTVFSIKKNGSAIGTITVSASGTVGVIATTGSTDFAIGDVLVVTAPSSQDATFADPQTAFIGSRA